MFYSKNKGAVILRALLWGIEQSGKTETLKSLIASLPQQSTADNWLNYRSIADKDREYLLEYLPIRLGLVKGIDVTLELFAPPASLSRGEHWLGMMPHTDGFILVVDSSTSRLGANLASMVELKEHLGRMGKTLHKLPVVCQLNKRDIKDALPTDVLVRAINLRTAPHIETSATQSRGVLDVLQAMTSLLLRELASRHGSSVERRK
ncbi:GTPase domain-containing protein [bacterium]|nr:GTPase domain-containing protein [bacterium]